LIEKPSDDGGASFFAARRCGEVDCIPSAGALPEPAASGERFVYELWPASIRRKFVAERIQPTFPPSGHLKARSARALFFSWQGF